MKILGLLIFLLPSLAFSSRTIELRSSPEGRNILAHKKSDFKISHANSKDIKVTLIENSFNWIRVDEILLVPTVRLRIEVSLETANGLELTYKNQAYSFQLNEKNASLELHFSLYEKDHLKLYRGGQKVDEISIRRNLTANSKISIDDTCSRNGVKVQGITNEAISLGCRLIKTGVFGREEPVLEIEWISPDLKAQNDNPIQTAVFTQNASSRISVLNIHSKSQKVISISATLPKRIHRLFTAAGVGFNTLETELKTEEENKSIYEPFAPALFFYANYQINEDNSIRGFNAAVFQESIFDNAGIYLGSDFGFTFDNRLYFTTLIGVQYLYFKYDDDSDVISEPIFPQGIEFMYRHAFDIPNYIVSGGFFLSTSTDVDYQNAWIRWGKNYFWEINYIGWAKDDFSAKVWGLSIGFPLKGFL